MIRPGIQDPPVSARVGLCLDPSRTRLSAASLSALSFVAPTICLLATDKSTFSSSAGRPKYGHPTAPFSCPISASVHANYYRNDGADTSPCSWIRILVFFYNISVTAVRLLFFLLLFCAPTTREPIVRDATDMMPRAFLFCSLQNFLSLTRLLLMSSWASFHPLFLAFCIPDHYHREP